MGIGWFSLLRFDVGCGDSLLRCRRGLRTFAGRASPCDCDLPADLRIEPTDRRFCRRFRLLDVLRRAGRVAHKPLRVYNHGVA